MPKLRRMIKETMQRFYHLSSPTDTRNRFEKFFKDRVDPWNYTSPYEQTKYERTLRLIPSTIQTALEIGCAEGHFTVQLAPRVRSLIACDISETALERAARRCTSFPHVRFARIDISRDPIEQDLDLVVCSETLYYVGSVEGLYTVARKIAHALKTRGYLVMAHANVLVDEPDQTGFDWQLPFGAKVIGEVFERIRPLQLIKEVRTPLYRIHLFQRVSTPQYWFSRRKSELLIINEHPTDLDPAIEWQVHWAS